MLIVACSVEPYEFLGPIPIAVLGAHSHLLVQPPSLTILRPYTLKSQTTNAMAAYHSNVIPEGFSIYQPMLGAPLQFFPAMGSEELDDMLNAYLPGPASLQEKRATVSLDFLEYAMNTGQTFKFYILPERTSSFSGFPTPASGSASGSPTWASPSVSSLQPSPVASDWDWSSISELDASQGSASERSSRKASSSSSRRRTNADFSHMPGMKILTKDGVDVTNSAARGSKTKEQRDHAHLMRIIKACESCKKKKIRCDPSHKKRGVTSSTTTQGQAPLSSTRAQKKATARPVPQHCIPAPPAVPTPLPRPGGLDELEKDLFTELDTFDPALFPELEIPDFEMFENGSSSDGSWDDMILYNSEDSLRQSPEDMDLVTSRDRILRTLDDGIIRTRQDGVFATSEDVVLREADCSLLQTPAGTGIDTGEERILRTLGEGVLERTHGRTIVQSSDTIVQSTEDQELQTSEGGVFRTSDGLILQTSEHVVLQQPSVNGGSSSDDVVLQTLSGDAILQSNGDTSLQTRVEIDAMASGDALLSSGDNVLRSAGDEVQQTSEDTILQSPEEETLHTSQEREKFRSARGHRSQLCSQSVGSMSSRLPGLDFWSTRVLGSSSSLSASKLGKTALGNVSKRISSSLFSPHFLIPLAACAAVQLFSRC